MPATATPTATRPDTDLDELVARYRDTGYLVLPGLFSAEEVATWDRAIGQVLDSGIVDPKNHRTPFRKNAKEVPERIDPIIDIAPVFAGVVKDPRITDVVDAILGGTSELFKDKLIFKAPGVEGYAMHQDASWWQMMPLPPEDLLSVSIAIDPATPDHGCIELFKGYRDRLLSTPGEKRNMNAQEAKDIDDADGELIQTQPGDVVIFHALTPHRSSKNTTHTYRRSFYLTYNAGIHGDLYHDFYQNDRTEKMAREREQIPGLYYR